MHRLSIVVAVLAVGLVGCPKPIRLELDAPETGAATVSARLLKGDKAPAPDSCPLPCGISIAPQTNNEITVKAPGFYPAVMSVTYEQIFSVSRGNVARLVVPMVARPHRKPPAEAQAEPRADEPRAAPAAEPETP